MLNHVIRFSLNNRLFVVATAALLLAGSLALPIGLPAAKLMAS